jgi:antitoxin ParD1/3/4
MEGLTLPGKLDLPPDLAEFAAASVANGRYKDASDMLTAGLKLLRDAEAERAAFIASLEEALAEGERDGFFTLEEVESEAMAAIDAAASRHA